MLILLFNFLNDTLDFSGLAFVEAKVVLIVLQRGAHAVKGFTDFAALVGNEGLSEEALGAGVVIEAQFFAEPVQNDAQVLLCLVVQDHGDLNLVVLGHDHQVVLDDVVLPDLNNLLEESLCVHKLSALLEELSHVEVAFAEVDALWPMLHALLVNAAGQLLKSLFVAIGSVLSHEETTESDIELRIVAVELLLSDKSVFSSSLAPVTSLFQQVPIRTDQELLGLLELRASHADVCLCENEVCWKQLNRLFSETNAFLDQVVQCFIDDLVGVLVLVHDKELLCPFNGHVDFLTLTVVNKNQLS